jgi:formate hydrogenlyase subunit 5
MTGHSALFEEIFSDWRSALASAREERSGRIQISVKQSVPQLCEWLVKKRNFQFAGMAVREEATGWALHYLLYSRERNGPWVTLTLEAPLVQNQFPSISSQVHAADWQERECEDHFGIHFAGHPRLGDFVLHDEEWQEGLVPMRKSFNARQLQPDRKPRQDWRPRRILHAPGAFAMSIGPIYGGIAEPVHFLLESVGEDIVRAYPRLFYKYRATEKIAEGRPLNDVLLIAERFNATQAFAHSFAFCRAVEEIMGLEISPRAQGLRVALAELERLRSHVAAIRAICGSTALVVAESQAALLEEDLLRLCGAFSGHRYLFGLNLPGGLSRDFSDSACLLLRERLDEVDDALKSLDRLLSGSSSFLDRLEEVGIVTRQQALDHGLVGPVARASGLVCDLRATHPYSGYERYQLEVPGEADGDGYARLRVLLFEAEQSILLIQQAMQALPRGAARCNPRGPSSAGSAFGWAEAAGGAALHWVWLDGQQKVSRYRILPPSFTNWHGFHLAAEGFAFQDLPIILATFALSVAENDR